MMEQHQNAYRNCCSSWSWHSPSGRVSFSKEACRRVARPANLGLFWMSIILASEELCVAVVEVVVVLEECSDLTVV